MTKGLNPTEARVLTYALYTVLFVLTGIIAWLSVEVHGMPEKYVRLERYQSDTAKVEKQLDSIDSKLDQIIRRYWWGAGGGKG